MSKKVKKNFIPRPLGKQVAVRITEGANITAGGIILADASDKLRRYRDAIGIVVAIGRDVREIKVGDQVLVNQHGGRSYEWDGEPLHVYQETDVKGWTVEGVHVL